ncbi:retrovirus-related pol polyprotein from transposon TNT 1-94 [Tanacetum coccineum]|uniref:Retrovirus-related pol polyprotein from transposon TNT 1-94 n=1 Tax=Tanacetum coccineum TaxID=301880 RepID=A0ABQ5H2J9_9ASTR
MTAGQRKPEGQWIRDDRKATNLDQRLKSVIMYVLPDDQMNSVINCLTAKSTWDDLILYHEGPADVKESRVMNLKLCYNTFKFKKGESLTQTFTRYKALMNDLVNDGIKLSKLEINIGFINGLPKKWLSLCQRLINTNHVKDSQLASLSGKLKYEENLIDNSPDEIQEAHEYLNDLEEEYQARAILAKSKRFFKKGTQRFINAKATDQTECHKCDKKGHFARDCWSKILVPLYQSPFQPKPLSSSQHKPKLRPTKDFEAKYNKVKAKLAFLSSSASASKAATVKNKGLITEVYEWDKEEVSLDDNEMVEKRILRVDQLIEDPTSSGQKDLVFVKSSADDTKVILPAESQRNTIDPPITITDSSATDYDLADESSVCRTPLPPLKKLDGVIINEPSLAPTNGNKISSTLKVNSAPDGKLKSVKIEDDPPLAIVMKELNDLKLQISKNQSSYSRNNQPQQYERTDHKTYDHAAYISTMNMIISLRRVIKPKNPQHVMKRCETCGSTVHTTTNHNDIEWFRRGEELQAKKPEALKSTKAESSNANRSKTSTRSQLYDAKYSIQYDEKRGIIFNFNKEVVMIAPIVRDVYVLDMTSSAQESCFFSKASDNLNWLWHKRLAHLKIKTINKLEKQNLVIGLPSLTSSIKKCLHLLYMDLFRPITPRFINHEKYTLVIVDVYSRYTWVYFLKKKSQAPETIMSFIKRVKNQNDIKVKQLRTDNGTKFGNSILVNFCDEKGISQNFSSPYTPEQNGVAERKNRTLIEAAKTMLSGSVFSKQYWTEGVATACYTQNRSTIMKRHLKTPYEIFHKRISNINFLHVFGCLVFIHNHKDHLGKFDEKANDGYLLGYSLVSKAFRVFNTRR